MTHTTPQTYTLPVSIMATGAATAVGYCAPTTAASVRAGINRIAEHPYMVDSRGHAYITARAKYLPDLMEGDERLWQLGLLAVNEALGAIGAPPYGITEIPVVIGLAGLRPGFTQETARQIETRFKDVAHPYFRLTPAETICAGHSAGLMALEKGCAIISQGRAPLCLAGGMDSWINPDDLEWLDAQGMLHSKANPWGFIPGEGAGFCLLASERLKKALDVPALARILAGATTREKNLIDTDTVCTGEALSEAISIVSQEIDPTEDEKIDQIICDLNGLRYRADEFGFALVKNGQRFKSPDNFMAPADCWGDVGAASGPLFISLAVHTAGQGNPNGSLNLILTGSDTGERSAMLIKTRKQQGNG